MNPFFLTGAEPGSTPQQRENLFALLIQVLESLEIPESEHEQMKTHYGAVSKHLEGCAFLASLGINIYPQGSIALGTTVRPLGRDEFDLDFIAELLYCGEDTHAPQEIYTAIVNRLREHATYKPMVELMNRCVRLTYAHQFHMDITPAAKRLRFNTSGLVVPDRERKCWVITNPKGYCDWFLKLASKAIPFPVLLKSEGRHLASTATAAAPLPEHNAPKKMLQHAVRMMKRHRDMYKQRHREYADSAPISVIITTLAALSYDDVVNAAATGTRPESSFDLLVQIVQGMTRHIVQTPVQGRVQYAICNPSEPGENFADKWNKPGKEALPATFYRWHQLLLHDLTRLASTLGSDEIRKQLTNTLGHDGVTKVFDQRVHDRTIDRLKDVAVVSSAACVTSAPIPRQSFHSGGDTSATALLPAYLTIRQQFKLLRQQWPDGHTTLTDEGNGVLWQGILQPTPLARRYEVAVVYRLGQQPRVHILSPSLAELAGGRRIPHLYNQQTFHLCLFDPRSAEWTPAYVIATTVLPWAMLWLEYFEDWLATHQWRGGGHDPGLDAQGFTRFPLI